MPHTKGYRKTVFFKKNRHGNMLIKHPFRVHFPKPLHKHFATFPILFVAAKYVNHIYLLKYPVGYLLKHALAAWYLCLE